MGVHIQTDFGAQSFVINDLHYWAWAYDQFIGDIRDLLTSPMDLPQQLSLDELDKKLEHEFELDAEHQRHWWLYYDRAAEAIPLLESDGPEHYDFPVSGFGSGIDLEKIREFKDEEAYINLVGSNVDRKMGDLSALKANFYAEPIHRQHAGMIRTLNHWVKDIKDNTNIEKHFNKFKYEFISIGSGVMKFSHGVNYRSSELALFKNYIQRRPFLTYEDLRRFEDVFNYHSFEFVPSFHVVRYRGAAGPASTSLSEPSHQQMHHFEHVSVAEARNRYPAYRNKIRGRLSDKALEMSPHLSVLQTTEHNMTTIFHHRIRFPIRETISKLVISPDGELLNWEMPDHPRYAIGRITRIQDVGIVDMDIDFYNHGQYDYVQCVYYPSWKHSAGIGMVKFGRDPAIVHNKLHNGALRWFGRSMKGSGFYVDGIVNDEDLAEMSRGNRWVKVDFSKLKPHLGRKDVKLSDFIVDQRPPAFPSAWSALMQLEEQALDRAMRSPGAWRGERTGYSGLQQSIASQDAGMMHSNTHNILKYSVKEMSDIVFSNVVQFDGDRPIQFSRNNENGIREDFELNIPMMPISQYDPEIGQYKMVPTYIKNHIGTMQFITRIEPESIVPDRPIERVQFFLQLLQFLLPYIQTTYGRVMLRGFQAEGMRIPSLDNTLDQVEMIEAEQMRLQGQLEDLAKEYQQLLDDREWAKDKAEVNQNLLRLMQKFVSDLARANPETITKILNGRYPQIQQDFTSAIQQLLSGMPNRPQVPSMPTIDFPGAGGQQASPIP